MSPLVNLVVVPLVAPAMAAGVVALAGGWLVAGGAPVVVGAVLAAPGWVVLRIIGHRSSTSAASLPFASVTLGPPSTWWPRWRLRRAVIGAVESVASVGRGAERRSARRADRRARSSGVAARRRSPADAATASRRIGAVLVGRRSWRARSSRHGRPGSRRISVLDVGQGDAILVEGSRGGRLLDRWRSRP